MKTSSQDGPVTQVIVRDEANPGICYVSGLTVYDEILTDGRWIGRYWASNGFIAREEDLEWAIQAAHIPMATVGIDLHAFGLEVDGQSLHFGWKLEKIETEPGENDGVAHTKVRLKSSIRPITVEIHTELDGSGFITRWLEISNTSDNPAALGAIWPWSGLLARTEDWQELIGGDDTPVFTCGYMTDRTWGREGAFQWQPLPQTPLRLESRMGRSGFSTPFFILRNAASGEHILGALEWSANWAIELTAEHVLGALDLSGNWASELPPETREKQVALLGFRAGPVAPAPLRILDPGETVTSPRMHLGVLFADLDTSVQAWHDHLRRSVLPPRPEKRELPVCYDHWGYHTQEVSEERLRFDIDLAADIGAEVFLVDAGWFGNEGVPWHPTVGDWKVGDRLPNGLEPIYAYAREKGLLCGLWMDAERIGPGSRAAREHDDWVLKRYGGKPTTTGDLDLTNPEAQTWLESQIVGLIERYDLDYFKLDYNTDPFEGGHSLRHGYIENTQWRHYEFTYALYDRIRERFPKLIMENCAGGGGRADLGMAKRFHHTLASDWQRLPRSVRILNGMTLALPPERLAYFPGVFTNAHIRSDLDAQMRRSILGVFLVSGLFPERKFYNPHLAESARHHIEIYKTFIRPFLSNCRVYHHTPVLAGREAQGWCALECVAEDYSRAVISIFRLAGDADPVYHMHPRGLDLGRCYRVTFDNERMVVEKDGEEIRREGFPIRIDHALGSQLLLFEAV